MGVKWSDASDRDLLLCIVAESQITATKWSAIADRMQAKGHEFSGSACSWVHQTLNSWAAIKHTNNERWQSTLYETP